MLHRRFRAPLLVGAVAAALACAAHAPVATAADHNDPVRVQAQGADLGDPAADIADIFAWYTGDKGDPKSLVLALTWRVDPSYELELDPTVRYGIHVDNDNDRIVTVDRGKADYDIWAWFGKNSRGEWGVKVENVPGAGNEPIIGPVGKVISKNGVKVMAGLFDDPFFFDLDGFFNGLSIALGNANGNPSQPEINGRPYTVRPSNPNEAPRAFGFVNTNDGFGKTNVHAIVIEIPADKVVKKSILGKHKELHVWATTARKAGAR